jgi:hypothetical protein
VISAGCINVIPKMAALAAIFLMVPGMAHAAACQDVGWSLAHTFPTLGQWVDASPAREQLQPILEPATWITGAILIWLLAGNSTRSTIVAACWFVLLAILAGVRYLEVDWSSPVTQRDIAEGCIDASPHRILVNLAFAAIAVVLTVQRLRKRSAG